MAAVKKWRQHLLGHHFTILIDHRSLKELMAQAIQTPEQQTYLARLMGYDYTIQYCASKSNLAADAFSRRSEIPSGTLLILTVPNCMFLQELKAELSNNPKFQKYHQQIIAEPHNHPECMLRQDLILKKWHIWLPQGASSIPTILAEYHSTPTGRHTGVMKTLARIRENFT